MVSVAGHSSSDSQPIGRRELGGVLDCAPWSCCEILHIQGNPHASLLVKPRPEDCRIEKRMGPSKADI